MCVLRHLPSISVSRYLTFVCLAAHRVRQVFYIVANCQHDLVSNHSLVHQIQHEKINHLSNNQSCFLKVIGTMQHLPGADAITFGLILLHFRNRTWLPAPGMIYQQFGIDTEQLVKQIFIVIIIRSAHRTTCNIAHRKQTDFFQFLCVSPTNSPKVGEGTVTPQLAAIAHFIQFSYTNPVFISRNMLCNDVHGNFGKVHIRTNTGCCSYTGRFQNILNHPFCKFTSIQTGRR